MNEFFIQNTQSNSFYFSESNSSKTELFSENWNITKVFDNSQNNPIADVYIQMSRPCGLRNEPYTNRSYQLATQLFQDGSCTFFYNGSTEHWLYKPAGFDEQEGSTY